MEVDWIFFLSFSPTGARCFNIFCLTSLQSECHLFQLDHFKLQWSIFFLSWYIWSSLLYHDNLLCDHAQWVSYSSFSCFVAVVSCFFFFSGLTVQNQLGNSCCWTAEISRTSTFKKKFVTEVRKLVRWVLMCHWGKHKQELVGPVVIISLAHKCLQRQGAGSHPLREADSLSQHNQLHCRYTLM